jgi:cytochrome c oxidase accessory protein FixG
MKEMISAPADNLGVLIGLFTFAAVFYGVYAHIREVVCTNICPYGRLQGVLMDKDSIIVAYDHVRGESRGKYRKDRDENLGDCIDCHQCVDVCPTGIDIRNGTQLECVNCTACIDACNFMMEKVGYDKGLIRYASENSITSKKKLTVTTRIKVFSGIMIALIAIMSFTLLSRKDIDATILRTSGKLYYELDNGKVGNLYSLKLINKTNRDVKLDLQPENKNATIQMAGEAISILPKAAKKDLTFFIIFDAKDIKEYKTTIDVDLIVDGEKTQQVSAKFIGPINVE